MTATTDEAAKAGGARDELYSMRRWVFEDSMGRFDIDLGDSHVQCGTVGQLSIPPDLELNYGFDRGSPELVRLVAQRYGGSSDHVVITHGAQEALYLLYCTLLRPGDRVISFQPGWQQAWQTPQLLGCQVEVLDLAEDFGIDLARLEKVSPHGLRLITMNSPNNPTGRRIRPEELAALIGLAERADAYLVADEEYLLDLSTSPATRNDRVISVSSLSKVAGFPGLRVGWMYGAPDVVTACAEYKHQTTISNSVLCEALAAQVLLRWDRYERQYERLTGPGLALVREFAARHPAQLRLAEPEGTPFAWLRLLTGEPSLSLARRVLETGVLVMPGEVLGATGGLRISFAREPKTLAEGLARIEGVLAGPNGSQNRSVDV